MDHIVAYTHRTFFSLANRNFRIFLGGYIVSLTGIWVQSVAQAWLVLQMTNSGTALGAVIACQFLPTLLIGAWAGVIVDRLPKRYLLLLTQAVAFVVTLLFWFIVATDHVTLWWVYSLALANGIVTAFDMPARQTFIFELVGESHVQNAVTLLALVANTARVVAPALAAVLLVLPGVGIAGCILINAATFIVLMFSLFALRSRDMFIFQKAARAKGQVREGLRYAITNPTVKTVLSAMFLIGLFTCEFMVTLPLIAKYAFHGNAGAYAALVSAMGIGSIIGGLIQAGRAEARLSTLAWLSTLLGVFVTAASMMRSFVLTVICLALSGMCLIMVTTAANAMMQLHTKPEMRGRMNALWGMIFMGTTPIGGPMMGWIAEHSSARLSLAVSGIAALVAGLAIYGFLATLPRRHRTQVFVPERAID